MKTSSSLLTPAATSCGAGVPPAIVPKGRDGLPSRPNLQARSIVFSAFQNFRFSAFVLALFIAFATTGWSQVSLTGTSYTENFDGIASGLPAGWTVRTGASATVLGTSQTLATTATSWASTTAQFNNAASANPPSTSVDNATTQRNRTDRALAVRQSGSFGDNSAAFVFQIANTTGLSAFNLSFKLMQLDPGAAARTATWNVDYGFGSTPTSFTNAATSPATLTTVLGSWGSTTATVNFGSALDNNSGPVWIRIVTKSPTTGTGSRPLSAIDDVNLTWASSSSTAPTISSFAPAFGVVGDSVTIIGTNFAANATVSFNGTLAVAPVVNSEGTNLSVSVPVGASSGPITIAVGLESVTSLQSFTVINPNAPAVSANGTLGAFSSTFGNASALQSLGVTGTNLTSDITATVPTGFEVSTDGTSFGPNATIAQNSGNANATLSVRISSSASAGALSGNLVISSFGATSISIPLSGNVTPILTPGIVVISQAYGGGGNTGAPYLNDFVELFNPGNSPVALDGWSLQYASATGTFGSANTTATLSGSIAPKGYFLIQLAAGTNTSAPLPAPDSSGNIAMSGTAFKIALVNSTNTLSGANPLGNPTIIDFVGAGVSANAFEGAGPAPAPGNTLAIIRKLAGEQETNDNAADFETGPPNPRNSGGTIPVSNITTNGTLTPFSTTNGTASASQFFTVNGANLTADITAVAPASYEVSIDNLFFGPNATLTQSGGIASGSIFVRLAASAPPGSASGNITLSSTGAIDRLVAVSGNVTAPLSDVPIVTTASFNGTVGASFSANITATNGPNSFSFSPGLPAGLTLNSTTGAITGTPTTAGNSSTVISATNGNGTGNATISFTIAKGSPTITTPPTATPIRVGQTLSNSTLSGGVASVNGTFAFTDPSIAPTTTGNQSVSFTPTDSANWNTATTNVSVTVNPAPTINVDPTSLTGFSTKENAASANQTLTVNGTNLEGAVTINASTGYQISTDGVSYSNSLTLSPNQSSAPVARAATIIASDIASNYGIAGNHTWGNGTNGGSGFQPWLFNVVTNDGGTPPPAFYAGAFVGDPVTAQLTNFPAPAFGLYANPGGTAASATVSRAFSQPLAVGDSFSFQWATNWDSDVGNKGFNIFAGGNQVVNVNQGGFPGAITLNGQTAIDGASGYGTQPMTWTFTRTTATNLQVTTTDRKGGSAVAFSTNITISAAPEGFSFYTSAMGQGDQRQPYFNNLRITSSGISTGGNLTNTTLYVRLAANGTPGAANGNLTFTSANATEKIVNLSGTVIELTEPGITSRTINGTVGSNLTASINATNSPTSHTASGTLPPGITFNATTGVFSGTPTTAGNYIVPVTATNADGTGNGTLAFVIVKGTPSIITPPTAETIFLGQTLANARLNGGSASITGSFAFTNPSIVPGLGDSLQSVTFTPTDSANWNTVTTNITVTVSNEPPGPPEFPTQPILATVGVPISTSANIANGPTSYSGNLPDGLTLNPLTGQIDGTPFAAGNFSTAVTASNSKGSVSGNLSFQIAKGTPTLVTPPQVVLYSDETLANTDPLGGLANIAGEFVFANPALQPTNGQLVDVLFTPFDQTNWNSRVDQVAANVGALPVYGLIISANINQIEEGDSFSEARIRLTHNGTTSRPLTVNFTATPAALEGDLSGNLTFVNFPASVTIPAGSNSTAFFVRAINDQTHSGNRTVTLTGTGRFLGSNSYPVSLTVIEDDPQMAGFAAWSNNATRTPALIRDYAIGGAGFGQQGQLPMLGMNATHMTLDALVRTDDPKLTYHGEWTTDLLNGPWNRVLLQTPASQTGFGNLLFSIPRENGETQKFLRLRIHLAD